MLFSRRADDADVIRARLRALLADGAGRQGWVPDDDPDDPQHPDPGGGGPAPTPARRPWDDEEQDTWSVDPPTSAPDVASGPRGAPSVPVGSGRHRAAGPSARVDPGPHGARTLWVVAVLAAVVVAGWSWFDRPAVAPVTGGTSAVPVASTGSPTPGAEPSSTGAPADIVVAVVGQVVSPGVVTLPAGSRVADAVAAAGGLLPEADPGGFNAAALLTDGQQVAVGVPGVGNLPAGTAGGGGAAAGLVDLNTATLADLDALPGIGPVLAQRILDHRAAQGPFTTVQELDDVTGIGPSLYAEISPLVTV